MSNRKKLNQGKERKDKALPFLTVPEADKVRALMREALAECGLEVTVFPDHLRAADGREFGVWNVASRCYGAGLSDSAWRRIVRHHVSQVMAGLAAGDPFDALTDEDLLTRTYTRLWLRDALPGGAEHYPHTEFLPGVVEGITLRIPDGVAIFNRSRVEQYGGWERLHGLGRANLTAHQPKSLEVMTKDGTTFCVARDESTFTASKALLMPEFADPVEGIMDEVHGGARDPRLGWLLAVPNRQEVAWHMVRDASALTALDGLTFYASMAHADSPGPLSPHVFWWSGEGYRQLTRRAADGGIETSRNNDLERALKRVA